MSLILETRNFFNFLTTLLSDTEINIISIYSMCRGEVQARYKLKKASLISVATFF